MGPDEDSRTLFEVKRWARLHPTVLIKKPSETMSRRWEVSMPRTSVIAFDSAQVMLTALSMISIPADLEDEEEEAGEG